MTLNTDDRDTLVNLFTEKAHRALEDAQAEISSDFSVNRSYYAMYYAAQAILLLNEIEVKTHKGVNSEFSRYFVKTGQISKEIFKSLGRAENDRYKADYHPKSGISDEEAQEHLKNAILFVRTIENLIEKQRSQNYDKI
jgi:uncharacterized protein (UPF0332 family)